MLLIVSKLNKLFILLYIVNIEEADAKRRKQHQQHEYNAANRDKGGIKKATDDYHYDKFKKQFRRH